MSPDGRAALIMGLITLSTTVIMVYVRGIANTLRGQDDHLDALGNRLTRVESWLEWANGVRKRKPRSSHTEDRDETTEH